MLHRKDYTEVQVLMEAKIYTKILKDVDFFFIFQYILHVLI